uniref:Transmembrane protein 157 n=1 Tax=Falco tinnunculus TaxID=100819 RepID=A0A8C4XIT5_FALTI
RSCRRGLSGGCGREAARFGSRLHPAVPGGQGGPAQATRAPADLPSRASAPAPAPAGRAPPRDASPQPAAGRDARRRLHGSAGRFRFRRPEGGRARPRSGRAGRLAEVSAPPEQGQPMTQRALSVLVLTSGALIVYFVIRTVRLRRRNRKTRRYGVLDTNIENMELTPLEQDDDDDDTTLFDANHPRRFVYNSQRYF